MPVPGGPCSKTNLDVSFSFLHINGGCSRSSLWRKPIKRLHAVTKKTVLQGSTVKRNMTSGTDLLLVITLGSIPFLDMVVMDDI